MKFFFIDFKRSLEVLKKINSTKLDGKPLINSFYVTEYNIWQTYQSRLFGIIQEHDFDKDLITKKTRFVGVKWFLAGTLSIFLSVLAFSSLVIRRKKVLVYSLDKAHSKFGSDTRLDSVYDALKKNDVSFTEFFHTFLGRDFRRNILKRKRVVLYLESLDFIHELLTKLHIFKQHTRIDIKRLDLGNFENEREKIFALNLIEAYVCRVRVFRFKTKVLSKILRLTKVTHLLAIDDPRTYFELLLACKENNIVQYVFQHGSLSKYHVGWLKAENVEGHIIKPDRIFVWSNFWKQELLRLGTYYNPDEIVVSGAVISLEGNQRNTVSHKGISILIPHERAASKDEVKQYIEKFIDCGARVFFKIRPGIDRNLQLKEYSIEENNWGDKFVVIDTIDDSIETIDFVAGTYSTFLYDMIAYKKLVILMKTNVDYGEGMLVNDLVESLDVQDDICSKLNYFLQIPRRKLEERSERLFESDGHKIGDTLEQIIKKEHLL